MRNAKIRPGFRPASDEERKKLGVPPAYVDVQVALDPDSDLVAVATIPGKNGKQSKTFYKYSKAHIERQTLLKYLRVRVLADDVEKIDRRILADCVSDDPRIAALGICARLVLLTGMRAGGSPQGEGESYGACTLKAEHVSFERGGTRFRFIGKKGVPQDVFVKDALIEDYVRRRIKTDVDLFPHAANALLRYMKRIGVDKTHDLRTLRAMLLAQELLRVFMTEPPKTKKAAKFLRKTVATEIAKVLGNNPSQVIKSYVSESIWPGLEED